VIGAAFALAACAQVASEPAQAGGVEVDQQTILEVQQQLQAAGYNPGPQSGHMNEETRRAIRDFQRTKGLPATGLVDRQTFSALLSASGTPRPGDKGDRID
jgi:peptidoglycan hydrolase-like protein with peptidoglycan-binding domain